VPIMQVKGGFRWGQHGHVYPTREGAAKQAAAAHANGYRGDSKEAWDAYAKKMDELQDPGSDRDET